MRVRWASLRDVLPSSHARAGSTQHGVQGHGVEPLEEACGVVGRGSVTGTDQHLAPGDHGDAGRQSGQQQAEACAYGQAHARRAVHPTTEGDDRHRPERADEDHTAQGQGERDGRVQR